MSRLEERYRRVLRLLPAAYRQEWEDEMVAAFLESMTTGDPETDEYLADYGRPSLPEVASVLSLAARLRLGGVGAPPRAYAWGQAVRLATLMGVLANAVMATAGISIMLWLAGRIPGLPAPEATLTVPAQSWHTTWQLASYAWLPAYLALVLGHRRVAQAVALIAVVPPVITAVIEAVGASPLSVTTWAMRITDIVLLLAMSTFRHDSPAVPRRPWLLAVPVGILLVPVPLFVVQTSTPALHLLDWPGLACLVVTAAIAVHLAVRGVGRSPGAAPWSLAFSLLATATLIVRVATLLDYRNQVQHVALATLGSIEAVAVVAVGVPVAVLAARRLRQLPPASTVSAG
ncbi:hypothetical protein QQG74_19475 [Micromonospora sp. FIMYZ51]|uniref:hypothetical protein n=1 Tax=Micromonospora sp. FIMYZ51 TaxID=3051832 RepID=UPI00311D9B0B